MIDIRLTGADRKRIAAKVMADIEAYSVESLTEKKRREHLGASEIGQVCMRRLVYSFRWFHRQRFDGRMMRLFNRGHLEEIRLIGWLRGIGATVWDITPEGKQISIQPSHGHFKGSLDSVVALPAATYGALPAMLGEYKTHNDKQFNKVLTDGVRAAKPEHFAQMSVYGEAEGLHYGLYFAVNKNDDAIHVECVELDWTLGRNLRNSKAKDVIQSSRLPGKVAATSAHFICKFCPMVDICHNGMAADRNCRSCSNSLALPDGNWACRKWQLVIPADKIEFGCSDWQEFGK